MTQVWSRLEIDAHKSLQREGNCMYVRGRVEEPQLVVACTEHPRNYLQVVADTLSSGDAMNRGSFT